MADKVKSVEKKPMEHATAPRKTKVAPKPVYAPLEEEKPSNQHYSAGNMAVQRAIRSHVIQYKMTVTAPNDRYEQEANRVADQVMRMPAGELPNISTTLNTVQRKCAACASGGAPCPNCAKEEQPVQRKENGGQASDVAPGIASQIKSMEGGGQPLSTSARSFFEPRFGRDFSDVRVHTDDQAANSARAINARAYTYGQNMVFASGQYSPSSSNGRHLLAHELTHTIHQKRNKGNNENISLQRQAEPQAHSQSMPSKDTENTIRPNSLEAKLITEEEFYQQTGYSADLLPYIATTEEDFLNLTGLPADTIPPGVLDIDPVIEPQGEADINGHRGIDASAGNEGIPNQIIYPEAIGLPAILARFPTYAIPPNSTGIIWTQLGAGHMTEFANVEHKLTARGFRGHIVRHFWATLFPDSLSQGIPGGLRNDNLFFTRAANQTVVYRSSNAQAAAKFAEQLVSEIPNYNQTYRLPPRAGSGVTVCGNNCITAPASLITEALGVKPEILTPKGPIDVTRFGGPRGGPYERVQAGRGATVRDWINQPDKFFEERGLTRVRAPRAVGYLKVGGGILMLYGVYSSGSRIKAAYDTEEFIPVVAEEAGAWALGAAGAAIGAKACIWAGPWALACALGGGLIGGFIGSEVGRHFGEGLDSLLNAPALLLELTVKGIEALEAISHFSSSIAESIFVSPIIQTFFSLRARNWDLRYVPSTLHEEFSLLQEIFSTQFNPSTLNEMLEILAEKPTMRHVDLPNGLMENLAKKIAILQLEVGLSISSYSTQELLEMSPPAFVEFLSELDLTFAQSPDYLAGYEGVWDNPAGLRFNIGLLISERATINPHNWDLAGLTEIELVDTSQGEKTTKHPQRDFLAMVQIVWETLGRLDKDDFRVQSKKPMSSHTLPDDLIMDIGLELEYYALQKYPTGFIRFPIAELKMLLSEMSPADFVFFLREYGVPIKFRKAPYSVAQTALSWVRAGYQPW